VKVLEIKDFPLYQNYSSYLVEAKQEGDIRCPQRTEDELDPNSLDKLPIHFDNQNPLSALYYGGKQTLKDNYFGQTVYKI
jgi:hypothetical protein